MMVCSGSLLFHAATHSCVGTQLSTEAEADEGEGTGGGGAATVEAAERDRSGRPGWWVGAGSVTAVDWEEIDNKLVWTHLYLG